MNKNFKLYIVGSTTSMLGSVLYNFAVSLYILDLTGSALYMSAFLAYIMILSLVIQPVLGVVVERHSKIKTMYRSDLIFACSDILVGILLFLPVTRPAAFILLYINGTIDTFMNALFEPASSAVIPQIVEKDRLTKAYSLISMIHNFVNIFGIVCAAAMYTVLEFRWILVINGLCVGCSAILEFFIKVEEEVNFDDKKNFKKEFSEGVHYIFQKKVLVELAVCAVITNIFLSGVVSTTLPFLFNQTLCLPPVYLASLQISLAVGSIIAATVLMKRASEKSGKIFRGFTVFTISFAIFAITYFLLYQGLIGIFMFQLCYIASAFILGCSLVSIQIPINVAYANWVEPQYMGRVMSLRKSLSIISAPFAMIVFGIILDYGSTLAALLIGGIGMVISTIYTGIRREIKNI